MVLGAHGEELRHYQKKEETHERSSPHETVMWLTNVEADVQSAEDAYCEWGSTDSTCSEFAHSFERKPVSWAEANSVAEVALMIPRNVADLGEDGCGRFLVPSRTSTQRQRILRAGRSV